VEIPALNDKSRIAIKKSVGVRCDHAAKEEQEKEAEKYICAPSVHNRTVCDFVVELELGNLQIL
jgi:hypothetical protein